MGVEPAGREPCLPAAALEGTELTGTCRAQGLFPEMRDEQIKNPATPKSSRVMDKALVRLFSGVRFHIAEEAKEHFLPGLFRP